MITKSTVQCALDENIPKDAIKTRQQAGITLSYLETWQVIDRLNQVLGQGNWSYQTLTLAKTFEGEVEQYSGKVFATSYVATVQVFAMIDGKSVFFSDVGYGDGTDKKNPGKAHELGVKEAVSDGLKRAAKNLGRSMGLALYDKTQEFVGVTTESNTTSTQSVIDASKTSNTPKPPHTIITGPAKQRPIKELITSAFKVLEAQKKITKEEFKEKYQGGQPLSSIPVEKQDLLFENVKKDFPHLNIS